MIKSISACTAQSIYCRILVAEDDKMIQNFIVKFLKHMGFDVATADNGTEALSIFQQGNFVLVLTDYKMPFMDGFTLAANIKERSPITPIIMLTGFDRKIIGQKMERGSVDYVIFKPFKLKDLKLTIDAALKFV